MKGKTIGNSKTSEKRVSNYQKARMLDHLYSVREWGSSVMASFFNRANNYRHQAPKLEDVGSKYHAKSFVTEKVLGDVLAMLKKEYSRNLKYYDFKDYGYLKYEPFFWENDTNEFLSDLVEYDEEFWFEFVRVHHRLIKEVFTTVGYLAAKFENDLTFPNDDLEDDQVRNYLTRVVNNS